MAVGGISANSLNPAPTGPFQPLSTGNIFQTPGEWIYNALHPTEPGSGQLTPEQVKRLATSTPSYVPLEGLTANLSSIGDSIGQGIKNIAWILIGLAAVVVTVKFFRK
jgi:hypothetical protein